MSDNVTYEELELKIKELEKHIVKLTNKVDKLEGKEQIANNLIKAEQSLRIHQNHLEELVEKRTANLEEANTALKFLFQKREDDRLELEEKMLFNVKELIMPYLEKMKKSNLDNKVMNYVDIIETNLDEITSPFVRKLSSKYLNFTAGEIKVANMIKHGNSTKEIAQILNLSHRTIDFHRANIRKKIGIRNIKANLRAHLLSLQ